ncbi:MAG: flagellar biosynthetic protein FliR [Planctomycetota bacterium]
MAAPLIEIAVVFVLVLARVGGIVATAPLLSLPSAPIRVRGLLALTMAVVITPVVAPSAAITASGAAMNLFGLARLITSEVLVGGLLGLGLMILLAGVQVAGQIISQMSGMALGEIFNPDLDSTVSVFSQVYYYLTLTVFAAIGGHRMLIQALLETFRWAPPGEARFSESYSDALITMLSQSFELGLRASAPIVVALFLSTVVLGLVSRTLPQINTVVVGFGVNSLLTLAVMFLSLGGVAWAFQEPLAGALENLTAAAVEPTPIAEPLQQ